MIDQHALIGTAEFGGSAQVFEVDLGESETSRVCGISGNPIRLGWNILGTDWQNCFLVPFTPPRSPQWMVFYHELGHNTTWATPTFSASIGPDWRYSEGFATYISLTTLDRIASHPGAYPLAADPRQTVAEDDLRKRTQYSVSYQSWLAAGAPFASLDPDLVNGILLDLEGLAPACFPARLFELLRPEHQPALAAVLAAIDSSPRRHTFFAALASAAAGLDLSGTFADEYHFPLDATFFADAFSALHALPPADAPRPIHPMDGGDHTGPSVELA